MLDDSAPLTAHEIDEWGDPQRNSFDRRYLRSYSPYQNLPSASTSASASSAATAAAAASTLPPASIAPVQYPHLFLSGAMLDPRVPYWQPAKYVAKLRALSPHNFMYDVLRCCGLMTCPDVCDVMTCVCSLFSTSFDSGHFDEGGRYSRLQVFSLEWLFLFRAVGMSSTRDGGKWTYSFSTADSGVHEQDRTDRRRQ
jgi:protease II